MSYTVKKRPRGRCLRCGGARHKRSRGDGVCKGCVLGAARARRERIAALEAQGTRPKDIALELGVSSDTIRVELWRLRHRPRLVSSVNTTASVVTLVHE